VCGICGAVQIGAPRRAVLPPGVLERMTSAMTHRGPDDMGKFAAPGFALGVRRLSIVDVAGGHQPVGNEDGTVWAAQNGELYNHRDIRRRLERDGHRFRTRCDTEVLPHLYEAVGTSLPKHLRGMFGLVVWDERKQRALIARDRLGIKPIYYAHVDDTVVFASELKSLLASGLVVPSLDPDAIDAYLSLGFVPAPATPLLGVQKLLPGHMLLVDQDGVRVEEYWSYPHPNAAPADRSLDEHAEELLELLDESVRLRLMSDVPLGAMLSGGLDSSLIVALMARHASAPVQTFSIGFTEAGEDNELADARRVAHYFGTDHHELELSFGADTVDIAELLWHLDEPVADLSALGFYALCELTARHVKVALSGQGADELLGGYSRYQNAVLAQRWDRLPAALRTVGVKVAARGPTRLRRAAQVLDEDGAGARLLAMKRNVSSAGGRDHAQRVVDGLLAGVHSGLADSALYLDGRLSLPDDMLHYFDRTSMAHSLEVRVPFLDHRVVEHCATIPIDLKVSARRSKYVLRHAARDLVPEHVLAKRKIGFFNPAVGAWFKAQARFAIADYLLDGPLRCGDFVDTAETRRLVRHNLEGGDRRHADALLTILMLEVWMRRYLPRALPDSADVPVAASAG
jgi:asparagine synthase (glutamine-hydrolysing)